MALRAYSPSGLSTDAPEVVLYSEVTYDGWVINESTTLYIVTIYSICCVTLRSAFTSYVDGKEVKVERSPCRSAFAVATQSFYGFTPVANNIKASHNVSCKDEMTVL